MATIRLSAEIEASDDVWGQSTALAALAEGVKEAEELLGLKFTVTIPGAEPVKTYTGAKRGRKPKNAVPPAA
jgi:hypothetical protein